MQPLVVFLDQRNRQIGGIASLNRDIINSDLKKRFEFLQSGLNQTRNLILLLAEKREIIIVFDESFSWKSVLPLLLIRSYSIISEILTRKARVFISREHHYSAAYFDGFVLRKCLFSWMLRISYSLMDKVISISASQSKWILDHDLCPESKLLLLEQTVDLAPLLQLPLANSEDKIVFGFIGRFVAQKGIERLLSCWAALPEDLNVCLIVSGSGPMEGLIRQRSASLRNLEVIGPSAAGEFYARCHVILIPSRYEPFGQVCLEAKAAGRLVIVSDVDGLPQRMGSGYGGYVCHFDDPAAFADTIRNILKKYREHSECVERDLRKNRQEIRTLFPKFVKKLERLFLNTMGE